MLIWFHHSNAMFWSFANLHPHFAGDKGGDRLEDGSLDRRTIPQHGEEQNSVLHLQVVHHLQDAIFQLITLQLGHVV